MTGYAVHNLLIGKYARQVDGMSLAIHRNLFLAIGLSPFFFFISLEDLQQLPSVLPLLIGAGLLGGISVTCYYMALRFLPMGVTSALTKTSALFLTLWAYIFLGESIPTTSFIIILIILSSTAYLGLQKHHMPHLDAKTEKGIAFSIANAFTISLSFFLLSKASREVNPLMAGYFWEVFIGLSALGLGFIRQAVFKKKIEIIPWEKFKKIAAISTLTLVGTGGYTLAIESGPLSVVATIGSMGTVVISLLAYSYHKEKLNHKQWIGILIVVASVIALKVSLDLAA